MKKIWTLIACTLMAASLTFAQEEGSQEQLNSAKKDKAFGAGVRAAFDYGMMYGFKEKNDNVDEDPSGMGFEGGLMARIQLVSNLYFAPEINVAYMSTSHELSHRKRTYKTTDLEIPLLMRGVVANRFYVTGGPQLNINLSNEAEVEQQRLSPIYNTSTGKYEEQKNPLTEKGGEENGFTFGLAAGAGFNIVQGLFIDLRFYMGLMDLYKKVDQNGAVVNVSNYTALDMTGAKMMKLKAGLSYWFM